MNLATARSARRAQEVGVRKVLGARREQLMTQFLGESLLITLIAAAFSLLFVNLLMPLFNQLSNKTLSMGDLLVPEFFLMILGIVVLVGLIAGLYPALFLSSFQPVKVMKGRLSADRFNKLFRQGLVVLQFAISLGLIIGTGVIYLQYKYMQSSDPGFQKDHIMIIPAARPTVPKYKLFKEDLKRDAHIKEVSKMNEIIGVHHNVHEFNFEGMKPGEWIYFPALIVDEDFVETMGLEVIAGRDFGEETPTDDTLGVLINETMVRERGWQSPEDALNRQFYTPRGRERVIGVVKDFHAVSMLDPIRPFVLDIINSQIGSFFTKNFVVRLNPANLEQTLAHCEEAWNKVAPNHPFEYSFLNEQIDELYADQSRLAKLIGYFSILAILIACSGLFALASFSTEQRTKEIGIRKVMGASISQIFGMLAWDFIKLVLLSSVLAFALAAYFLMSWLEGFAFHTSMPWWIYGLATLSVGLLALFTVGYHAYKAGSTNPAIALKDE
jgi:putative ABC transport system permease protein